MSLPSLLDLPPEIHYYICDQLDTLFILRSLRLVCRQLYAISDTYSNYKLDLTVLSETDIRMVSLRLQLSNVASLVTAGRRAHREGLDICRNLFDISRFIHIRSLTIRNPDDHESELFITHLRLLLVRPSSHPSFIPFCTRWTSCRILARWLFMIARLATRMLSNWSTCCDAAR